MTITAAVLVWARTENLERLARALRMPLPPRRLYADPRRYRLRLARMIAAARAAERHVLTLAGAPWLRLLAAVLAGVALAAIGHVLG